MSRLRRFTPLVLAIALLALPAVASAHAELVSSDPADGAVLDAPPSEVVLTFEGEVTDESGFTVSDADGAEVGTGELDLDVAERNVLRGAVTITEPGTYTVDWTGVAEDGHPETGSYTFTYEPVDDGESPDTALPLASAPGPLPVVGGLLLLGLLVELRCRLEARAA